MKDDDVLRELVKWASNNSTSWSPPKEIPVTRKFHAFEDIAEAVMDELVANGLEDLLLVKNLKVGEWWAEVLAERKHKAEMERQRQEAIKKAEDDRRARESLLARLTSEEKRLLGF